MEDNNKVGYNLNPVEAANAIIAEIKQDAVLGMHTALDNLYGITNYHIHEVGRPPITGPKFSIDLEIWGIEGKGSFSIVGIGHRRDVRVDFLTDIFDPQYYAREKHFNREEVRDEIRVKRSEWLGEPNIYTFNKPKIVDNLNVFNKAVRSIRRNALQVNVDRIQNKFERLAVIARGSAPAISIVPGEGCGPAQEYSASIGPDREKIVGGSTQPLRLVAGGG